MNLSTLTPDVIEYRIFPFLDLQTIVGSLVFTCTSLRRVSRSFLRRIPPTLYNQRALVEFVCWINRFFVWDPSYCRPRTKTIGIERVLPVVWVRRAGALAEASFLTWRILPPLSKFVVATLLPYVSDHYILRALELEEDSVEEAIRTGEGVNELRRLYQLVLQVLQRFDRWHVALPVLERLLRLAVEDDRLQVERVMEERQRDDYQRGWRRTLAERRLDALRQSMRSIFNSFMSFLSEQRAKETGSNENEEDDNEEQEEEEQDEEEDSEFGSDIEDEDAIDHDGTPLEISVASRSGFSLFSSSTDSDSESDTDSDDDASTSGGTFDVKLLERLGTKSWNDQVLVHMNSLPIPLVDGDSTSPTESLSLSQLSPLLRLFLKNFSSSTSHSFDYGPCTYTYKLQRVRSNTEHDWVLRSILAYVSQVGSMEIFDDLLEWVASLWEDSDPLLDFVFLFSRMIWWRLLDEMVVSGSVDFLRFCIERAWFVKGQRDAEGLAHGLPEDFESSLMVELLSLSMVKKNFECVDLLLETLGRFFNGEWDGETRHPTHLAQVALYEVCRKEWPEGLRAICQRLFPDRIVPSRLLQDDTLLRRLQTSCRNCPSMLEILSEYFEE